MNTTITKSFHVEHSIGDVWANLTNPEKVVVCVPGASLTQKIDDNNYKGEVELKFGPVKARYGGLITFTERDAAAHKMTLKGTGTDTKGKGGAEMGMTGKLSEKDGGTDVDVSMEVSVTGMLAQFGSRLINDVSNHVFDQFVSNFKAQLSGQEVDTSLHTGSMVGSVIKGIFGGKKS
ncbi:MAG: SRPBCC family protein [Bacteroidota bacterium]|nr:SRPBCC family protein [Bacteroidota bacterium]